MPVMTADTEQIKMREAQGGSAEAFGALYDAYVSHIYRFVYSKTLHKETAEDIVSQVFMKAYAELKRYSPARGSFRSWLYQIARNAMVDHFRARRPTVDIEDVWDLAGDMDISRDVDNVLGLEKIRPILATLPAEQRDIILMRVWQEMSYAEIAEALGKTEASCKMGFMRGIKRLREQLPLSLFLFVLMKHLL